MSIFQRKFLAVSLSALVALQGCAFVNAPQTNEEVSKKIEDGAKSMPTGADSANRRLGKYIDEPYLGGRAVPVARDKLLPAVFSAPLENPTTLVSGEGRVNLSTVAERITQYTGIPVEIDQNVFIRSASLPTGSAGVNNNSLATPPVPVASPPGSPMGAQVGAQNQIANLAYDSERTILLSYSKGPLSKFLDLVAAQLSISWEYSDGKIRFLRYKTQTFEIKALAGSNTVGSSFSSSGEIASSAGGSGSTDNGQSKTSLGVDQRSGATLNNWSDMAGELNSMLSAGGKIAMNQTAGTVTVSDTPQVLRQIASYIEDQNRRISRTVYIQVDVYTLQTQKGAEAGLDIALELSKGNFGWKSSSVPSVAQSSGGVTGTITGTSANGTTALIQALGTRAKVTGHTGSNAFTINNNPVPFTMSLSQTYVDSIGSSQSQTSTAVTTTQKQITTGAFIQVLPHLLDNNRLLLQYTVDLSDAPTFDITKVDGGTIKSPSFNRRATAQVVNIKAGETLVLTQMGRNSSSDKGNLGLLGASAAANESKETTLIMITPVLIDSES